MVNTHGCIMGERKVLSVLIVVRFHSSIQNIILLPLLLFVSHCENNGLSFS